MPHIAHVAILNFPGYPEIHPSVWTSFCGRFSISVIRVIGHPGVVGVTVSHSLKTDWTDTVYNHIQALSS